MYYQIERREHTDTDDAWEAVSGLVKVPDDTATAERNAQLVAVAEAHYDDPEYRATTWWHDIRINVYADIPLSLKANVPARSEARIPDSLQPDATFLVLGGQPLVRTPWFATFAAARQRFLDDVTAVVGRPVNADDESRWRASVTRATLLGKRTMAGDIAVEPGRVAGRPGDGPVPHTQHMATRILEATTLEGPDAEMIAQILGEFLATASLRRNWWRPGVDPEPADAQRVFDGHLHYQRVPDGWKPEGYDPAAITGKPSETGELYRTENVDPPARPWSQLRVPLVVDSTEVAPGSWRINDPKPGAPVADWMANGPDEVIAMLNAAIDLVRARAGRVAVAGSMWTPRAGVPVFFIRVGGSPPGIDIYRPGTPPGYPSPE